MNIDSLGAFFHIKHPQIIIYLTIFVIGHIRTSRNSLTNRVGIGSTAHKYLPVDQRHLVPPILEKRHQNQQEMYPCQSTCLSSM